MVQIEAINTDVSCFIVSFWQSRGNRTERKYLWLIARVMRCALHFSLNHFHHAVIRAGSQFLRFCIATNPKFAASWRSPAKTESQHRYLTLFAYNSICSFYEVASKTWELSLISWKIFAYDCLSKQYGCLSIWANNLMVIKFEPMQCD